MHTQRISELHISSLVIKVEPIHRSNVESALLNIECLEIVATQDRDHQIIVVIETPTTYALQDIISDVGQWPGVYSVSMVYHHCEPEVSLNEVMQ